MKTWKSKKFGILVVTFLAFLGFFSVQEAGATGEFIYQKSITIDRTKIVDPVLIDASSSSSTGASAASTLTWSHTVTTSGSNRLLIVGVSIRNDSSQTVSGVKYHSVAMTSIGSKANGTSALVEMYYLINPDTGAHNVVVTLSAAAEFSAGAVSYTNVDQTNPLGTFVSDSGSGAVSLSVSSALGEVVMDTYGHKDSTTTAIAGSNQGQRWNTATSNGTASSNVVGAGSTKPGASSVTMSWASGADTGYKTTGHIVSSVNWTTFSTTRISSSNDLRALTNQQDYGICSTYGFGVPSGTTVKGIEAWVEGSGSTAAQMSFDISLSWDAGSHWTTAQIGYWWSTSDDYWVWGGSTEAWNRTWSLTDFDDSNFQFRIGKISTAGGPSLRIDYIALRVYYTYDTPNRDYAIGAVSVKPVSTVSTLSNFPLLVNISGDADLKDTSHTGHVTSTSGHDIIFRALDDTTCGASAPCTLSHEVEKYDGTNGDLTAWVKLPSLNGNGASSNTVIYMLYGNSSITTSTEQKTDVWTNSYLSVYHLKEDPSGSSPQMKDSTSNGNNLTSNGTMTSGDQVSGQIDGSLDFDGSDDYLEAADIAKNDITTGDATFSAWIKTNETMFDRIIMDKYSTTGYEAGYAFSVSSGGTLQFIFSELVNGGRAWLYSARKVNDNSWHHVVAVRDTSGTGAVTLYIDGTLDSTLPGTDASGYNVLGSWSTNNTTNSNGDTFTASFEISGQQSSLYIDFWPHNLDEGRVSTAIRAPSWILAEYNNQYSPSTFYSVGPETGSPASPAPTVITLRDFSAAEYPEGVVLQWKTAYEASNLGFNIYREEKGRRIKLNPELISGSAFMAGPKTRTAGHSYAWLDDPAKGPLTLKDRPFGPRGERAENFVASSGAILESRQWRDAPQANEVRAPLRYWLEDVDLSGKRTMHGPVVPKFADKPMPKEVQARLLGQLARGQSDKERAASRVLALQNRLGRNQESGFRSQESGARSQESGNRNQESALSSSEAFLERSVPRAERSSSASAPQVKPEAERSPRAEVLVSGVDTGSGRGALGSSALGFSDRPGKSVTLPGGQEKRVTPQEVQWVLAGMPAVKIFVQEEGWYRVSQPELVGAGLDPKANPRYLQLYVEGEEQAIEVKVKREGQFGSQDAIEFYGVGEDTPFTDTRVYWLVAGGRAGKRIESSSSPFSKGGLGGFSFPYTVERKPRMLYVAALKNGDESNFFGPVVMSTPVDQTLGVSHVDLGSSGQATLRVALQGATEGTHRVKVLLNDGEVGTLVFEGQASGVTTLPISQRSLLEGENRVTLMALGGETDISVVDSIRLTYWRTYTAENDALRFTVSGGQQVLIDGFSSSRVRVVDITDPKAVQEVGGTVKAQGSGFGIQVVAPGSGPRTLLAFTEGRIEKAAALEVNQASRWYQAGWGADLVIISHALFQESMRPLKTLREGQGWSVVLVDVEDLYDEFSFGKKTPQAIKDFLLGAKSHWRRAPRFVLLVGDASVDPRNYLGVGDFDYVPTKLIDTSYMETASDDWLVDFNLDGLPDMAIGRFPVRTVEEANVVVSKVVGYEQSASPVREVMLVADLSGEDFDFESAAAEVRGLVPGGFRVSSIYRSQFGDDNQVHTELLRGFNEGKLLVDYVGHGSVDVWRGDIFSSQDAESLTNGYRLPLVVAMTCLNGFFHDLYTESLAEALLKSEQGGAVAVWASSGLTEPDGQVLMNKELIRLLFSGESLTIGEAVMRAKGAAQDPDVRRSWILFGDPTTKLKY